MRIARNWDYTMRTVEKTMVTFAIVVAILCVLIPLLMAFLWSFVSADTPWSYPDLFPRKLALDRWREVWGYTAIKEAMYNSYRLALTVGILAILLALPSAYALGRYQFRCKAAVEMICLLPLMMPGVTVALFFTQVLNNIGLDNKFLGITMGHLLSVLPFSIRILTSAFCKVPQEQIDAARDLGAKRFTVFMTAYLPIIRPAAFAAFIYVILRSIEEFNISFILGSPNFVTVPTILFSFLGYNFVRPNAAVVSLILVIPNIFLMLAIEKSLGIDRVLGNGVKG